jgi:predicted RNA-binding protein with PIN domain
MRWVVDAMNVIGTHPDGWWKDRHGAMVRLIDQLEHWAGSNGEQVTVVFEHPPKPPIASSAIEVAHAPRGGPNAADQEIVHRLRDETRPDQITVVTSDRGLAEQVRTLGASVEPAESFRRQIEDT